MVLGVVGTGRSWKRNEHTLETHDLLVFIRMLYFLGSNRSLYRGGKYISSALINDIYIQMDKKKNERKVCSALSRVLGARITRVGFVLSLPLYLRHRLLPHARFVGHPLRVTSFVLNRFGGLEMQYPVESARHSSRPTWLVKTV